MKSLHVVALTVALACIAGIAAQRPAFAFDVQACMAKCRDQRCKENCEVQANRAAEEQIKNDPNACEGREDPRTHVISFAHCK